MCIYMCEPRELGTCGVYRAPILLCFLFVLGGFFLQEESTDTQLGEVSSQAVRAFPDLE